MHLQIASGDGYTNDSRPAECWERKRIFQMASKYVSRRTPKFGSATVRSKHSSCNSIRLAQRNLNIGARDSSARLVESIHLFPTNVQSDFAKFRGIFTFGLLALRVAANTTWLCCSFSPRWPHDQMPTLRQDSKNHVPWPFRAE